MTTIKAALAGAGAFGTKHLDAIKNIAGVEVVSVMSRDLGKTKEVAAKYGPLVGGAQRTFPYVIVLDGRDVGYVQTYRIGDHPAYAREIGVDDESAGLDLFLGEPDCVGRGLGPLVSDRFVRDVVFATTAAVAVVSDPSSSNPRSVRAFEKAGFRRWRTVVPTDPACGDLLLRRDRPPAPP